MCVCVFMFFLVNTKRTRKSTRKINIPHFRDGLIRTYAQAWLIQYTYKMLSFKVNLKTV